MKWPTAAETLRAVHLLATAVALLLLAVREPECAAVLLRVAGLQAGPLDLR